MVEYVSLEEMQDAVRSAEQQAEQAKARKEDVQAHKQRLEHEALKTAVREALRNL